MFSGQNSFLLAFSRYYFIVSECQRRKVQCYFNLSCVCLFILEMETIFSLYLDCQNFKKIFLGISLFFKVIFSPPSEFFQSADLSLFFILFYFIVERTLNMKSTLLRSIQYIIVDTRFKIVPSYCE